MSCSCSLHLSNTISLQVVSDFTSELEVARLTDEPEAAAAQEQANRRKRQIAWLERGTDSTTSSWKAEKRPRTAAYHFCRYLDNQV